MTPKKQSFKSEDLRKVMRQMQIRMCNNALHHFTRINARTLRMLQGLNLFAGEIKPIGDILDISVFRIQIIHDARNCWPVP